VSPIIEKLKQNEQFKNMEFTKIGNIKEGYDDGNEDGAGEKLLYLLQRMGVENIMVIVTVHDLGLKGRLGADFYRMVLSRARELLQLLHSKLMTIETITD